MFDHVTIRVSDRGAAERFYDQVLRALELVKGHSGEQFAQWGDFSVAQADAEKPVTRNLHVGFAAPSRADVDEFWRVGTEAGHRDDGAPGLRPRYRDDYDGAFLLDPDGNSAEAVHHGAIHEGVTIDHLWIRVADVAEAKRFYQTVAPHAGFRLKHDGERAVYHAGYHGAFVLDPDGDNVELVSHNR